jgi:hypothetical protein
VPRQSLGILELRLCRFISEAEPPGCTPINRLGHFVATVLAAGEAESLSDHSLTQALLAKALQKQED